MENRYFGIHYTLDASGGNRKKLSSKVRVKKSTDSLPKYLKMKKLCSKIMWAEPNTDSGGKDTGGWSSFTMIAESHISIHTFPDLGFASIDCYTCHGSLDTNFVKDWFQELFDFDDFEEHYFERGRNFPFEKLT
jgi:S-adenosylmethionine decarboxylase